ncbi:class I SAM-dependent methyltransferase [Dyella sp.]|jgi:SAM-dependent methyltransferase|uniref:class I SAM-dependent methyltransferase n=1 Tax=Dyella sp. TaxID=1869338 RepID=UPI002D77F591|nr:class I SAM-dependent methyltransferase [Dyella sp.]HET6430799.1 class I SAM-dependent methyltransferase [Dyella sp.]
MRIEDVSDRLVRNSQGIYVGPRVGDVSYSQTGHADCFQVEDRSFWFRHRNDCIAALVTRFPYTGTLLDIGGGNGYVSQRLIALGGDVVLIEPGPMGALNARKQRGIDNVACALLEDAGFKPGTFGAIGMFDVIEHIEDDRGFLDQIAPLLAADGRLYLTVPCHTWLWSGADVSAGHFRRHTRRSLQALLSERFVIDYISYFFQPLVLPQWLLRALPYRLGRGRDSVLSTAAEHGTSEGLMVRVLERLLRPELQKVMRGETIRFGASALVAARLKPRSQSSGT